MGEAERDVSIGGRYLDRMEKRDGEWRIAQRAMLYAWYQDFGVSVDWSHGVMGMPFSATAFYGRANGAFSESSVARRGGKIGVRERRLWGARSPCKKKQQTKE